jgi:serine protease
MHTLAVRRSFASLAVGALTATGLVLGPVAAETPSPAPSVQPARKSTPVMAAGIIVTTTGSAPSAATLRKAESVLGRGNDVAKVLRRGGNTSVLFTTDRLTGAKAQALAAELRSRPDVVSASPNYIRRAFDDSPVVTDDTFFSSLKQIWDPRTNTDSRVKSVLGSSNKFPSGGYSSKAPALWDSTKGSGEVVAVIDTGITSHPELDSQVLPGYDFISDDGSGIDWGRDGDGRDSDPSDMGDWENASESCDGSGDSYDSSWHGTHVAGIIAAEGDNAQGIVGVAPSVKILPVRVLGLCGGTDQDIADGIRWAAGLTVPGAPVNSHPADVINLSLGGFGKCSDSPTLEDAIAAAQGNGAVVVAAAGNDGVDIVKTPVTPATCTGVISVGATSEYGDRAGYLNGTKKAIYSNYGKTLDISAPGGDSFWDNRAILSTVNTGTTSPVGPGYAEYEGTSMAAPVVAAGAALIRSTGTFTPAQTEAALKAAVAPFPTSKSANFKKCTTSICGKGILDLSKVVAPTAGASISGSLVINESLTAVPGGWNLKPAAFKYQWLRDDAVVSGATAATYRVSADDVGHSVQVRISPSTGPFVPATVTAYTDPYNATVVQGPDLSMTGLPASTKYGIPATVTVKVGTDVAPVDGPVELRRGSTVVATGTAVNGTVDIVVPGTAWMAGANAIHAAYLGNGTDGPMSTLPATVTVAKATSAITISLPATVKATEQAALSATVTVAGIPDVPGDLQVFDGSKKIATWTLGAGDGGTKTVLLPKITKKGSHKIKVVYVGTANITGKTSAVKKLTVN